MFMNNGNNNSLFFLNFLISFLTGIIVFFSFKITKIFENLDKIQKKNCRSGKRIGTDDRKFGSLQ